MPPFAPFPKGELERFERDLRAYAEQLDNAADKEGHKKLQLELDELNDRIAVPELQETAKKEVERLKLLRLVNVCIADTATNAITALDNDIADNVITPKCVTSSRAKSCGWQLRRSA